MLRVGTIVLFAKPKSHKPFRTLASVVSPMSLAAVFFPQVQLSLMGHASYLSAPEARAGGPQVEI